MLDNFRRRPYQQVSLWDNRVGADLRCGAASMGFERRQDEAYDWHGLKRGDHPFGLLQLTLAGEGRLQWEGTQFSLATGDVMLLQIPHQHRYWLPDHAYWEHVYACIVGEEALRLLDVVIAKLGPVFSVTGDRTFQLLFQDLMIGGLRQEHSPYQVSGQVYAVLMHLLASIDTQAKASALPGDIQRAIDFAGQHFAEFLSLDDLAAAAGCSRYHFSRRFSQHMQQSPGKWLQAFRLEQAADRLLQTSDDLQTIALATGFSDGNYFGKAFRKVYGVSPGVFRRSGMYGMTKT